MKTLLISLHNNVDALSLNFLHYNLLHNGYDSSILYLADFEPNNEKKLEQIKKFISKMNPKLIGFSVMSHEYHIAVGLSRYLKSFVKSTPIIWGGIHPTMSAENCLDYADYICLGEGEKTILDIANAIKCGKDIKNINNLCYSENGIIKRNQLYPPIENLDSLPFCEHIPQNSFIMTNKDIMGLDKKYFKKYSRYSGVIYNIITTRGCPFHCSYCCNNVLSRLYHTNKIRKRSIQNTIDELKKALRDNPKIEYINFLDDCFLSGNDDYFKNFSVIYKKEIGKPFAIRGIPIFITEEKIKHLKYSGLAWITAGLQSGSNRVCRDIYKRTSLNSDFLKAAQVIKNFNIAAFYDVISDNPFENEEDKLQTVEVLMKTPKPFYLELFSLTLYHGTELHEKAKLECPERIEDPFLKDYSVLHKEPINNLIRLAALLSEKQMKKIVQQYKKDCKSAAFKARILVLNILTFLIVQPITYFRLIKLSQHGSYLKTFKVLPFYFKRGIELYLLQFISKIRK